jgi:hypothetical protein
MPKKKHPKEDKVALVMSEFAHGNLHSGSKTGKKVTNPRQAAARAFSEAKKVGKKKK